MKNILLFLVFFSTIGTFAQVNASDANLLVCEEDTDGYATFDLTQANTAILNGQSPADLEVSYYSTEIDAETAVNPLMPTYSNVIPFTETLYTRVENIGTGNFATGLLVLEVGEAFQILQDIPDNVACDQDDEPMDGITQFNLTTAESLILGELSPANYSFHYYLTQDDAENAINEITDPENFTNTYNPITIFVVVKNESGCTAMSSFELYPSGCWEDYDNDLVSGADEDVNNNGNLNDDDTDGDGLKNYMDNDDDGDGILTADEDYNGNGDPTDDDTDNSGVADYLEENVALATTSYTKNQFSVYPNPAKEAFFIEFTKAEKSRSLQIFTFAGKMIKEISFENSVKKQRISITDFPAGIYFLRLNTAENTGVRKLIVR